ncbi:hypothetical protein PR202_gb01656 [Eleusine coracana subsp. coracana]|uniref:Uncharacterized protein n=1 Tax=Eleusine coracana subsp. coracana TaxID=191504 RepID=A0AAV5DWM0_ELECO|nr:hypothetical protein PR202_gb01656 [Eleusine coracana subsp. coracana]
MARLDGLMSNLTWKAAHGNNPRMFAAGAVDHTPLVKIYGMAQCTGDLGGDDCYSCLDRAVAYIPTYWGRKQGGQAILWSCFVRFESAIFYNVHAVEIAMSSSPALAPVPAPGDGSPNYSNHSSKGSTDAATGTGISQTVRTALLVSVPVAVTLLVFMFVAVLTYKKNRKPYRRVWVASNMKRLSATSEQGQAEMKNEIVLVAKLQHKNLVRLLGFCMEQDENLLVYELLSNKSLNKFLYGPTRKELSWAQRYKIIKGIGRGLLYLHEDSRLKIIHRDLKPGNILLDVDMNPKISDFGLAKLFNVDSSVKYTIHQAGTYGYMAPEYVLNGIFSAKSDVFSYGVLVLEVVTCRRPSEELLKFVWRHWRQENVPPLLESCPTDEHGQREMLRCIHIGLLCVQDDPELRPRMADVDLMLKSHFMTLVAPTEPVFAATGQRPRVAANEPSINKVSISDPTLDPPPRSIRHCEGRAPLQILVLAAPLPDLLPPRASGHPAPRSTGSVGVQERERGSISGRVGSVTTREAIHHHPASPQGRPIARSGRPITGSGHSITGSGRSPPPPTRGVGGEEAKERVARPRRASRLMERRCRLLAPPWAPSSSRHPGPPPPRVTPDHRLLAHQATAPPWTAIARIYKRRRRRWPMEKRCGGGRSRRQRPGEKQATERRGRGGAGRRLEGEGGRSWQLGEGETYAVARREKMKEALGFLFFYSYSRPY